MLKEGMLYYYNIKMAINAVHDAIKGNIKFSTLNILAYCILISVV